MSVIFKFPDKSNLIPTSTVFQAQFNVPTVGFYDFTNTPANQNVPVLDIKSGKTYFIDKYSVGGNITEGQFLESINTFPQLRVLKKWRRVPIYKNPIPIVNYTDNGQLSNFLWTDTSRNQLWFTFEGILRQLPSMVGINIVRIQVQMDIWEIDDKYFTTAYRDVLDKSIGQANRRGL